MRGSPVNIQRDASWIKPETASDLTWPTANAASNDYVVANADATVHADATNAHTGNAAITMTAGQNETIGCFIEAPDGDNTPYRVKASCKPIAEGKSNFSLALAIGYAPASITGSDDQIEDVYYIPFEVVIDELIMVPHLESGDPFYGRALFIGLTVFADATLTAVVSPAHVSVQRLAIKPPTMQNAVS